MTAWWEVLRMKDPEPGSVEARLAAQDVAAAREYLQAFVDDQGATEWGRFIQAISLLLVDLDRRTP